MPKLLSPDHNQGGVSDSDPLSMYDVTALLSIPVVDQTDNVVNDHVNIMSQGSNSNPMYIKSRIEKLYFLSSLILVHAKPHKCHYLDLFW